MSSGALNMHQNVRGTTLRCCALPVCLSGETPFSGSPHYLFCGWTPLEGCMCFNETICEIQRTPINFRNNTWKGWRFIEYRVEVKRFTKPPPRELTEATNQFHVGTYTFATSDYTYSEASAPRLFGSQPVDLHPSACLKVSRWYTRGRW